MFSVCPEWPVILGVRDLQVAGGVSLAEIRRGIHATHDLHIHRLARVGDILRTSATITSMEQRKPGVFMMMRLDTVDADGEPVATTWQGSLYLDTQTEGPDRVSEPEPTPLRLPSAGLPTGGTTRFDVAVGGFDAHLYTECARIWNPIHTDPRSAQESGLGSIILHGTATLAKAISVVVDQLLDGDPTRVARIGCRFAGWVPMPSTLVVTTSGPDDGGVIDLHVATVENGTEGRPALAGGYVVVN